MTALDEAGRREKAIDRSDVDAAKALLTRDLALHDAPAE